MSAAPLDPVANALTGHLPFDVVLAAVLTWPIAVVLLRFYTRAVRRSMRSPSHKGADAPADEEPPSHAVAAIRDLPEAAMAPEAAELVARLVSRPRHAATVYAVAGGAYAVVMALAQLRASQIEVLPLRFLMFFWLFAWPVVISTSIVATTTRGAKLALATAYVGGLVAIGGLAMPRSPDLTWMQVFVPWLTYDVPATVLLLTYLSRGVRAVGPLVLTFLLLALIGSDVVLAIAGSRDSYGRVIVGAAGAVGLGGTGAFVSLIVVGFMLFAIIGWGALLWIRRRYDAKKIGDESLTIDAIWLFFTIVYAVDLAFERPLWVLAGPAAFAAYAAVVRAGFWWLRRPQRDGGPSPSLLLLRSFSIGHDSERLFDALEKHWRRTGSIQMIAGVDLDCRTVEPHEFLDFLSGRLSRRFIDGEDALNRRIAERDLARDEDLRYRVNEFFCYDDTWKTVLSRLVHESTVVLMDLRGFSADNRGCVFELRELARLVPLGRVVFVVDRRTDEALLAATLGQCTAGVVRFGGARPRGIVDLLRALAGAAS